MSVAALISSAAEAWCMGVGTDSVVSLREVTAETVRAVCELNVGDLSSAEPSNWL